MKFWAGVVQSKV